MTSTNKNSLIANRYAESLIELVKGGKLSYEKVAQSLEIIENVLNNSADLDAFLTNPIVSIEDKKEVIDKIFASEVDILMSNFLKVLIDKERFSEFREIVVSYKNILDRINNISRVTVTSAIDLSEEAKNRLKTKLESKLQKTVTLDWEINPEIIAGLVIKMGDNVIDTSLKNKLEDLSKSITR